MLQMLPEDRSAVKQEPFPPGVLVRPNGRCESGEKKLGGRQHFLDDVAYTWDQQTHPLTDPVGAIRGVLV